MDKPWKCRKCSAEMGTAGPTRLSIGPAVYVVEKTKVHCSACGAARTWVPLPRYQAESQPPRRRVPPVAPELPDATAPAPPPSPRERR